MLLHLEQGTCASGVGLSDIDEWSWNAYMDYSNGWTDIYKYRCPVSMLIGNAGDS
jgi:hypothetical protein